MMTSTRPKRCSPMSISACQIRNTLCSCPKGSTVRTSGKRGAGWLRSVNNLVFDSPRDSKSICMGTGLEPKKRTQSFLKVAEGYRLILVGLGLDMEDPHLKETPKRAAKALVKELCSGLITD